MLPEPYQTLLKELEDFIPASRYTLWTLSFLVSLILVTLPVSGKSPIQGGSNIMNAHDQSSAADQGAPFSELVQIIHQEVNAYRDSRGLQPLTLNPFISKLAREHSQAMANGEVPFGHGGFEQRARILKQEFAYHKVAENVGTNWGYANPAPGMVEEWLHSPDHLKNIRGDFELTGIGVAKTGRETYYFTQIFLKR